MAIRLSFLSAAFPNYSAEELIYKLVEWGYEGVELNAGRVPWAEPHVGPDMSVKEKDRIKKAIEKTGLEISSLCVHISLIEQNSSKRKKNVNIIKGCIDLAVELSADVVHAVSGPLLSEVSRSKAWKWLVEGVSECIDYAEERDIRFALEPVVNGLIWSVEDTLALLEELKGKPLYINFDPSHLEVRGEDVVEATKRLADKIVHVHMKDAKGKPANFQFPPLGMGTVDFAGILKELRKAGYEGFLSVEYEGNLFGYKYSEEQIARKNKVFIEELLKKA